jgi:hypothetical protein
MHGWRRSRALRRAAISSLNFLPLNQPGSTDDLLPTLVPNHRPAQPKVASAAVHSQLTQARPRYEWRTDENGRLVFLGRLDEAQAIFSVL